MKALTIKQPWVHAILREEQRALRTAVGSGAFVAGWLYTLPPNPRRDAEEFSPVVIVCPTLPR